MIALLLSVSGFVFCAIFLPFERLHIDGLPARTMATINTIALLSFVIPLYFVVSIKDGSEKAFREMHLLVYPWRTVALTALYSVCANAYTWNTLRQSG